MATVSAFDFHDLARKAVPFLLNEDIESAFSSIEKGNNPAWKSLNAAMTCFEKKIKLDYDMNSLKKTINSHPKKKKKKERRGSNFRLNVFSRSKSANRDDKNIQNARIALSKLTINCDTGLLLRELERGFSLNTGTLSIIPNDATQSAMQLSKVLRRNKNSIDKIQHQRRPSSAKQRSHSVTRYASGRQEKSMLIDRTKSSRNIIALQKESGHIADSPNENENENDGGSGRGHGYSKSIVINSLDVEQDKAKKRSMSCVPNIGTKQYLQFLLERALSDKAWNDNDAERLCKAAVAMNCDWITVHSMWVPHCHGLITRYHEKKLKHQERQKKMKKSRVRSSRKSSRNVNSLYNDDLNAPELDIIDDNNDDNAGKKEITKICTTIGYPSGSSSTASKVAEAKQAVSDGSNRIRLMISAGKVVIGDWSYIMNEIKAVVNSCSGADVRIVFPDTPQITKEIKQTFNEKIIKGMSKKGELDHELMDEKQAESQRIQQNKKRIQKYIENEMSETDNDSDDDNDTENEHDSDNNVVDNHGGIGADGLDSDDTDESDEDDADDSDEPTPKNAHRSRKKTSKTKKMVNTPVLAQSYTVPLESGKEESRGPGFSIPPPPNRKPPRMPHRRQQTCHNVEIQSLAKAQHRRVGSDRATRLSKFKYKAPVTLQLNVEEHKRQRRSKSRGDIRYKHKRHESRSDKKHKKSSHKHSSRDHGHGGSSRRHKHSHDRHHSRSHSRHASTHKSKSKSKHSHSHRNKNKKSRTKTMINL